MKVQPQEPLVLKDLGNTDWHLLQGDTSVTIEVRHWLAPLPWVGCREVPALPKVGGYVAEKAWGSLRAWRVPSLIANPVCRRKSRTSWSSGD